LARAATATLRSYVTGASPTSIARSMWDDGVTGLILRATSSPATTTTTGWAKEIAGVAVLDLVQSVTSISAAAEVIDRALKLNMDGIAEYRVPGRILDPTAAAAWVAEAGSAPVRNLNFSNAAILRPHKLEVLSVFTREMSEHSNIEAIVRQTLGEAVGLALDLQMFSADPGDATKPPGLFAGSDTITATTGGGMAAMDKDLELILKALAAKGGGKNPVIITSAPQAIVLKRNAAPKFDIDILSSTAVSTPFVGVVETASLVSGFGSVVEFSTAKYAAVHMEDTAPADFPAAPMKSMFQIDSIIMRSMLSATWGLRAAGHAQWVSGCTW